MLTLVISLPLSTLRQKMISAGLRAAGMSFSMLAGVVGRELSAAEFESFAPSRFMARFRRDIGPAEVGCTLSHKLALETFLASNEETALILEDDAVVPANLGDAIALLVDWLPRDWGVLKVGGIGGVRGRLLQETAVGKIVETHATTVCAHAYVVSRQGASQLLRRILPIRFPYDIYLRDTHVHGARTFEVVPTLVVQEDLAGSRIECDRMERPPSSDLRSLMAYRAWKLGHEIRRRAHIVKTIGLSAAVAPSRITRHS
jgi:glycosyl transferase, family 25